MIKKADKKKFIRVKDGVELYGMSRSKLMQVAKDADAIYKVNKVVLLNCEMLETYLETFRLVE